MGIYTTEHYIVGYKIDPQKLEQFGKVDEDDDIIICNNSFINITVNNELIAKINNEIKKEILEEENKNNLEIMIKKLEIKLSFFKERYEKGDYNIREEKELHALYDLIPEKTYKGLEKKKEKNEF